ncbi:MAG: citryl-CoA lyase [Novosphingobium lindaniclasticum]|jgi:citrate synthase|uniref:citryl-CoA lyase n=1 Tax=Novosphingobium lindaniclasticum TaxID=1329895 RepID=UPI002409854D|nr:citryl-CoA lyase [Novosphingobium lindaniclasticum]MDF2640558.1 citryl-CoA lyase [Novosphingobium lindaniclasticum]
MRIGSAVEAKSGISASNPEMIVVRGYDLSKGLVGHISFTDHVWLLITGTAPEASQRRVLDATLVAIAEHGLVPSVVAARMTLAAAPEALQGAVAAGILGCGSVILGSSQAAGDFFHEIAEAAKASGDMDGTIRETVTRYRAAKRAIPGYGHPLHKGGDARAARLFEVAAEAGLSGEHIKVARAVEALLPELIGKALALNVSAAIPAVLLDAGFPVKALKGIPILARTASLVGHLLEEQLRPIGFIMAHEASSAITYDGTSPEGFVANEG